MAEKGWFEVIRTGGVHAMTGICLIRGERHFIEKIHAGNRFFRPCGTDGREEDKKTGKKQRAARPEEVKDNG